MPKYLTREQVERTRAKPHFVDCFGYVRTFTVGNDNTVFDGSLLQLGNDGKIYAVFIDCVAADRFADIFFGCLPIDNAYQLDTVH